MRVPRKIEVLVEVEAIRVTVPVHDWDREDWAEVAQLPQIQRGPVVVLTIALDTGRVEGWPGGSAEIMTKVRDEGRYELLDHEKIVATRDHCYVPAFLSDDCDDYLRLVIVDGCVARWAPNPNAVAVFFFHEATR